MILKNLTLAMGLVAAMATSGSAAAVYGTDVTGTDLSSSRSGAGEITGAGNYAGVSVAWIITNPSAGVYHYDYTFKVNETKPDFSHVILELSANAGANNITNLTGATIDEIRTFSPGDTGNSNPGLPANIYGAKFAPATDSTTLRLVFDSDRSPVWGNFYSKGAQIYAYNNGLDPANQNSDNILLFVARPDGTGVVPEPSSIALLGCGAIGLMGVAARRRKSSGA